MNDTCPTPSKPVPVGASGITVKRPAASTSTKSVAANASKLGKRNTQSPQKGSQKHKNRLGALGGKWSSFSELVRGVGDKDFVPSSSYTRVSSLSLKNKNQKRRIPHMKTLTNKSLSLSPMELPRIQSECYWSSTVSANSEPLTCSFVFIRFLFKGNRKYHIIVTRKYKTLHNVYVQGARFKRSGTPLFGEGATTNLNLWIQNNDYKNPYWKPDNDSCSSVD